MPVPTTNLLSDTTFTDLRAAPSGRHAIVVIRDVVHLAGHPFKAPRRSLLMVEDANLAWDALLESAEALLTLPDVVPTHLAVPGSIRVPHVRPNSSSSHGLLWAITDTLSVLVTGVDTIDLVMKPRSFDELRGVEWWSLARALVTAHAWCRNLQLKVNEIADDHYRAVDNERRGLQRVRIFHKTDDTTFTEVYDYDVKSCVSDADILESAFTMLNRGGPDVSDVEAKCIRARYARRALRSLSVGDVVAIGRTYYRCAGAGWERTLSYDINA